MHGTIMLLFFATPIVFAFANLVLPLQIGAPDVAFPRLNAFSYWLYLFGALDRDGRFLTPGGAADFGWYAYAPLTDAVELARAPAPTCGSSAWPSPVWARSSARVNMVTTVITPARARHDDVPDADLHLEHPGHQPAGPAGVPDPDRGAAGAAGSTGTWARRSSTPRTAAPILWQHLFWFFGHPEVYIVALPFFGIVTEVIPVFSRKPLFGYKGMVCATLSHRRAVADGVGAPHVRHRRGAAAVLLRS